MAFGMSVINDSGAISIDSEFARLSVLQAGSYSGSGASDERNGSAVITLSPPITTQEPPMLFVRPDNNGGTVNVGCVLSGSPGNWTAFTITGQVNYNPEGRYFVGGFSAPPVAKYGFRLWDGTGKLIFDSGTPSAVFTRFFHNWSYEKSTLSPQRQYTNWYSAPLGSSSDEYLLINNATMRMISGDNLGRTCGIVYEFSASKLWFTTTSLNNPIAFSLPAVFAKITA